MGLSPKPPLLFLLVVSLSPCFWFSIGAQSTLSPNTSARPLDAILQDYAYRAFVHPKTGVPYDASVPSNLTGIMISALRLRSGSLRLRGVKKYKEFELPVGIIEEPYQERIVLVYQNLGNWSNSYYPLDGYTYLSPVLGLLAYSAANLSATNLPELDFKASLNPILIHHPNALSIDNKVPRCVWFDLNGAVNLSSVVSGNTCSATSQGHFALVVEGKIPLPPASVAPTPPGVRKQHTDSKVWIIVGSVVGGLLLVVLLAVLLAWLGKYKHRKKMQKMETAADAGEALRLTSVGSAKAPSAVRTRTQPSLETEYVP